MAKDRVFTSSQYRTIIDEMKKNDVLGLNIVEGIYISKDTPTFTGFADTSSTGKTAKVSISVRMS